MTAGESIRKVLGAEAPDLTFPFEEKRLKELPWPHQESGASKATVQRTTREAWVINDFPLYQSDGKGENRYFHGGLYIVLDNGTKIYAMKGGWVKAIVGCTVVIDEIAFEGLAHIHLAKVFSGGPARRLED